MTPEDISDFRPMDGKPSMHGWIGLVMVVCAAFLTFKYFPGVENSHYYGGFILKAIHPDLLANDPILGTSLDGHAPYQMTAYYLLPKLFGEIWLDDRFILPFYFGLVLLAFFLVDRIVVALGGTDPWVRAVVLLLFLRDHKLLESEVNLAHQPDFHHSAFAIPLSLLIFWACITRKPIWVVLGTIFLLVAMTAQVAPLTAGAALIAMFCVAGSGRDRIIYGTLIAGGIGAAIYVFGFHLVPAQGTHVEIWNILKWEWYEGMVAPFETSFGDTALIVYGLVTVFLVCMIALFWRVKRDQAVSIARIILAISLLAFVLLGLYGHGAPDVLKFPQLFVFPVTRQFQGAQTLAFIAATVFLLRWAAQSPSVGRSFLAIILVGYFTIAGPGNHWQWLVLVGGALSLVLVAGFIPMTRRMLPRPVSVRFGERAKLASTSLAGGLGIAFVVIFAITFERQAGAWGYLARHGIHGSSAAAEWREVADWIRENTSAGATLLPLQYAYTVNSIMRRPRSDTRRDKLVVMRTLVSRTGRIIPKPMLFSKGLDLGHFHLTRRQLAHLDSIGKSWRAGQTQNVLQNLNRLPSRPDYLIVPKAERSKIDAGQLGYSLAATVGHYCILRSVSAARP